MANKDGGLPSHLLPLLNRLSETGKLFIEVHKSREERMQAIACELAETSEVVVEMQKDINATKKLWVAVGGLGLALGVGAAFLSGEGAMKMAVIGAAAAFVGGAGIVKENATKEQKERASVETVAKLGKEFMAIINLLMDFVKEIKVAAEELNEKSSCLRSTTGSQAKAILSTTTHLQKLFKLTADLSKKSKHVTDVSQTTMGQMRNLLDLITNMTRIAPTLEADTKLRNMIRGSAEQCEKTIGEFTMMRSTLADFEEHHAP